jgi:glucosamine kinase
MSYFLGFDGGGTKTECVLVDGDGHVLTSTQGGPSNPLRTGYSKAWFALSSVADAVLERNKIKSTDIRGICAGLGGAGRSQVARRVTTFLQRSFPSATVRVTGDLDIALAAAAAAGKGVVLLAGTGSAAVGRNNAGKIVRAGGRGPWIGDEGSAFDIGRRALAAVYRAADGIGPKTDLSERVLGALEFRSWDELLERIAKSPDDVFPKIFPLVCNVAESGDKVAREILVAAAGSLAELARSVVERLQLVREQFELSKAGGVFGRSPLLDTTLDSHLAKIAPRAHIMALRISPAQAAAEMARNLLGEVAHAS